MSLPHAPLKDQVRSYYGTVGRYIESELRTRRDRPFWRRVVRGGLSAPDGPAILELGCGTGRITEVLAAGAATVVAIDLCPDMIRRARRRLSDRPRVHLVVADMRSLRLNRRFDLVVAANDPFVHLLEDEDRNRALRTVRRHLTVPHGRFVLDGFRLRPDRHRRATDSDGDRRERRVEVEGSEFRIRESWHCTPGTRRCEVRYEYFKGDVHVDEASFRARLWDPERLAHDFRRAGLEVEHLCGGFDGRPFEVRRSGHMIIRARPTDRAESA